MIIGIGTDLIDIRRIEKTLARYGQRFLDRVFTPGEQAKARLAQALAAAGEAYRRHRSSAGHAA